MKFRRPTNPHDIAIKELSAHWGVDRGELNIRFDIPVHPKLCDPRNLSGLQDALGGYLDDRTKSRWRRIIEALAG